MDQYDALHEDIPDWLAPSLALWLDAAFRDPSARITGRTYNVELILKCERKLRLSGLAEDVRNFGGEVLISNYDDPATFAVVDFLVHDSPFGGAYELETMLEEAGSAWKVGTRNGVAGLERRVSAAVQEAADHVMSQAGDAGQRLSEAWHAAFGLKPNSSQAYGLAIKAVEDAAAPVVSPKNRKATLGMISGAIRDQGDWSLPFDEEDDHFPSGTTVRAMMRTLAAGQTDRHGGAEGNHSPITQEAAEAAVMLAVPLVQWFTSSAVQRRATP